MFTILPAWVPDELVSHAVRCDWRYRSPGDVSASHASGRALLSARFDERLAERTRVAREIHDTLLQTVQGKDGCG